MICLIVTPTSLPIPKFQSTSSGEAQDEEKLPPQWNISIICPIFKEGYVKECILHTAYEILSISLCESLKSEQLHWTDKNVVIYFC